MQYLLLSVLLETITEQPQPAINSTTAVKGHSQVLSLRKPNV